MLKRSLLAAAVCGLLTGPALADTLELTGAVRDFKRGDWSGGHPDFQTAGAMGRFGHVLGLVTMNLDEDGKPVYNPVRPSKDTIYSEDSFATWFRDDPDVNVSAPLTLIFDNGEDAPGGVYTFHDSSFFPIDEQFFGNQSLNHNFHFTFELKTSFSYIPGQHFTFIGDDDVWVYVNGVRVIDLGGVHAAETAAFLLFDGKAFVEKADFPLGGVVQEVTNSMANQLAGRWANLGLPGSSPIQHGDRYINLDLNQGGTDVRASFASDSVTVWSAKELSNVVIQFNDYTEQKFDNLSGYTGTFAGTGEYEGKIVTGVWIKSGSNASGDGPGKGAFVAVDGSVETAATLDFFFAERHTTQSNFRIDTSILLQPEEPSTISPLYD